MALDQVYEEAGAADQTLRLAPRAIKTSPKPVGYVESSVLTAMS